MKPFAIIRPEDAKCRAARSQRPLEYRIEHWREISRRRIDDLQHLGGGGLPLERLAGLAQKPHVLDRDHCLVSKCSNQLNLFVGKWTNLRTRQSYNANAIFISVGTSLLAAKATGFVAAGVKERIGRRRPPFA